MGATSLVDVSRVDTRPSFSQPSSLLELWYILTSSCLYFTYLGPFVSETNLTLRRLHNDTIQFPYRSSARLHKSYRFSSLGVFPIWAFRLVSAAYVQILPVPYASIGIEGIHTVHRSFLLQGIPAQLLKGCERIEILIQF